ncbi:MAG: manganese efflux pump MntP family protein [Clostridiales bacterium]|nr:manganese efflux pump MntP family protein [Clostridiales bacterium]
MGIVQLLLVAVSLSMDAFAVSICSGLIMKRAPLGKAAIIGLYFGVFQAIMPLIGFFAATLFADKMVAFDHWIAFGLLAFLGVRMIIGSLKKDGDKQADDEPPADPRNLTSPKRMLPLAVATSIDALAVGASFAFVKLSVNIFIAVAIIGATTFSISVVGVKIGNIFGNRFKAWAELAGGIILTLIGVKILVEHLLA